MELQVGNKVKFKAPDKANELIGTITEISIVSYLSNRKQYDIQTDKEIYLNIPEESIISYFPDAGNNTKDNHNSKSDEETELKRGDCVILINDSMNVHDHVIVTAIYSDNTIGVIDLLGRVYVLDLSNTYIKWNFGNIIIPEFGEVNETRIPVFDDFKYHYGDIVTYNSGLHKYVGRIESGIHIDTDLYPSSIEYQIINIDSSINALRNYNEIEPGDYRMKEQEQKTKSDKNFTYEWDEESGLSVHGRCDKCPATDILNQDSLAGLRSHDDICSISFHKPLVSIYYNNGGESNIELPEIVYNKKVGFLLAYIQSLVSTKEYHKVISVMESINKNPQQDIEFDETCNEDD